MHQYFVYILTNSQNDVFYTGVTSNLEKRIYEHKSKVVKGFTEKYNTDKLIYFEVHEQIILAIQREKKIKRWKREWKLNLIKSINPGFYDLSRDPAPAYRQAGSNSCLRDDNIPNS